MAKKSKKLNLMSLIMVVATVLMAVMTFVSMTFTFIKSTGNTLGTEVEYGMQDWFDIISETSIDAYGTWRVAKVFMIILLVLIALLAVVTLLKLFIRGNKIIDLCGMVLAVLTLVVAIVFIILMYVGVNKVNDDTILGLATTRSVDAGPICMTIFGIVGSVTGFLAVRK